MSRLMNGNRVWWLGALLIVLGLTQVAAFQLGNRTADEWVEILEREQ
jgi:hypothetical protein